MIKQISKNEIHQVCGGVKEHQTYGEKKSNETITTDNNEKRSDRFVNMFKCYSYIIGSIAMSVTLCRNVFELNQGAAIINNQHHPNAGIICLVGGGANGFIMGLALCIGIE